ncbi:MAG: hypothetical protein ACRDP5_00790 [Streptosporangiaceae bacterium]
MAITSGFDDGRGGGGPHDGLVAVENPDGGAGGVDNGQEMSVPDG